MPLPPPPAAAFTMIGKPILFGYLANLLLGFERIGRAGTTGTPAADISLRDSTLSPIARSHRRGTNEIRPAFSTARAKPAFSEKNP